MFPQPSNTHNFSEGFQEFKFYNQISFITSVEQLTVEYTKESNHCFWLLLLPVLSNLNTLENI